MQLNVSVMKTAGASVVITVLLLAELHSGQLESAATTHTRAVPEAISRQCRQGVSCNLALNKTGCGSEKGLAVSILR